MAQDILNSKRPPQKRSHGLGIALRAWLGFSASRLLVVTCIGLAVVLAVFTRPTMAWLWAGVPWLLAPFTEWVFHRYVLHSKVKRPGRLRNLMEGLHYAHHREPSDLEYINAPASTVIGGMVVVCLAAFSLLPVYTALPLLTGLATWYTWFEFIHVSHHIKEYRPFTEKGRRMRRLHNLHHYKDESKWWGLTSDLADRWLGTAPDPKTVAVSASVYEICPLQNDGASTRQPQQPEEAARPGEEEVPALRS